MSHPYNEAGRRLLAAVMSYQLSIKMDYCLRKYVPEEVDNGWAEMAETLLRGISEGIVSQIRPDLGKSKSLTNKVQ